MKNKHKNAYMSCAKVFSSCSTAERLKVGAVLVKNNRIIGCGYNAQPEHIHSPCEDANGQTSSTVRHAEKNVLMGLIKSNESSVGAEMFCTHSCCLPCAVDIVDAGIEKFYYLWEYRSSAGVEYLKEHGVIVEKLEDV